MFENDALLCAILEKETFWVVFKHCEMVLFVSLYTGKIGAHNESIVQEMKEFFKVMGKSVSHCFDEKASPQQHYSFFFCSSSKRSGSFSLFLLCVNSF